MRADRFLAVATAFLTSAVCAAPAATSAQHVSPGMGRAAAKPAHTVSPRSVAAHASTARQQPRPMVVRFNPATNSFQTNEGSFVSLQDLLNPVPAPGFSFRHLAAINQDLPIKALIDPATQLRLAEARRVRRHGPRSGGPEFIIWPGGDYYYPASDDSGPAPDQTAESEQPAEQQQEAEEQPASQQPEENYSAQEQTPLPDVGQFTLVLQNGDQLQAVAFAHVDDKIVYITTDGSRRTIAAADLNPDATVRVNQERGTALQLPL
jgi:hypothetical protein